VGDEVFADPAGAAQRHGVGVVGGQRCEAGAVGAQGVGEHVGVEAVVFVAGRPVPAREVFDLVRADHHHRGPRLQQGVDDRSVGAFDRDLTDPVAGQHGEQLGQPGGIVLDGGPVGFSAAGVHDRHGVVVAGPVDAAGDGVDGFFGQGVSG